MVCAVDKFSIPVLTIKVSDLESIVVTGSLWLYARSDFAKELVSLRSTTLAPSIAFGTSCWRVPAREATCATHYDSLLPFSVTSQEDCERLNCLELRLRIE